MKRRGSPLPTSSLDGEYQLLDESKGKCRDASTRRRKLIRRCLLSVALLVFCYGVKRGLFFGDSNADLCSIYMAPSSLNYNGEVGSGIFTTEGIPTGSWIINSLDGPSIPLIDFDQGPSSLSEGRDQWHALFDEYTWERGVGDELRYEANHTIDYQISFGSLFNHHCILGAVTYEKPDPAYDDSAVDRFKDPGAGAFSYHAGRDFKVTRHVEAGEEIFLNYEYCNRNDGASHGWPVHVPVVKDYDRAAQKLWSALESNAKEAPTSTSGFVASLLPKSMRQLRQIIGKRSIQSYKDIMPLIARHIGSTPRTVKWIRSNGLCLEHLIPGPSSIPQAGWGALSQHLIRKGQIVVPSPVLHILDKDVLNMYDSSGKQIGKQLLLNYCLGHPESSILLCPMTNAMINHCSNRKKQCGPDGPNAEYRWSSGWDAKSDAWRKLTIEDIAQQPPGRGLSMEVVALRDIQPGEEVFVDYGIDWEEAWEKHVSEFKPPIQTIEPFLTAKEANEQECTLELLVTGDLRKVPDHPYLMTACRYWTTDEDFNPMLDEEGPDWTEMDDSELLSKYASDGSVYALDHTDENDKIYRPCVVVSHSDGMDGEDTYTVRILEDHWHDEKPTREAKSLPLFLTGYPRRAIRYFVKPYASDQHLPNAFRHPIGIPDEIFPGNWKNRAQTEKIRRLVEVRRE